MNWSPLVVPSAALVLVSLYLAVFFIVFRFVVERAPDNDKKNAYRWKIWLSFPAMFAGIFAIVYSSVGWPLFSVGVMLLLFAIFLEPIVRFANRYELIVSAAVMVALFITGVFLFWLALPIGSLACGGSGAFLIWLMLSRKGQVATLNQVLGKPQVPPVIPTSAR